MSLKHCAFCGAMFSGRGRFCSASCKSAGNGSPREIIQGFWNQYRLIRRPKRRKEK